MKYFEKYKLNNCIETKYEDQTIPLAYNVLFREAYKDTDNYKFQILSGSCVPMKSFDFIYNKLIKVMSIICLFIKNSLCLNKIN